MLAPRISSRIVSPIEVLVQSAQGKRETGLKPVLPPQR